MNTPEKVFITINIQYLLLKMNMDEIQPNPFLMHFAIYICSLGILGLQSMSLFPLENQSPFICVNHPPAVREKNNRNKSSLSL